MSYGVRLFQVVAVVAEHEPITFERLLQELPQPTRGGRPPRFEEDLARFLAEAEGRYVSRREDGFVVTEYGRANFLSLRGSVSGGDWELP